MKICVFVPLFLVIHAQAQEKSPFFVQGSLLYWQAQIGGIADGVKGVRSSGGVSPVQVENPHFPWDIGFALGIGTCFTHDEWQLLLKWTSFKTHANVSQTASLPYVLAPSWTLPQEDSSFFQKANQHWRLHLGLVDLFLNKAFYISSRVDLIPQIGLRFGSIRQKCHLEYIGEEQVDVRTKNKFWGIGPVIGLRSEYSFKQWGFFAEAYAGGLYGEFYVHQAETERLGVHQVFGSLAPFTEGSMGFYWKSPQKWTVEMAWDQRVFFSQNQWLRFLSSSQKGCFAANQGDLTLAGVHANVRYAF
jgi:hypothetical protein